MECSLDIAVAEVATTVARYILQKPCQKCLNANHILKN